MNPTIRPVTITPLMVQLCGDHKIPNGWAHCRCGKVPLDGADFCGCLDHKTKGTN